MAKFSRDQLKSLVKECLCEILADGLGGTALNEIAAPRQRSQRLADVATDNRRIPQEQQRSVSNYVNDRISMNQQQLPQRRQPAAQSGINESMIAGMTQDSVMRDILANTASTSLQEMLQAEASDPRMQMQGGYENPAPPMLPDRVFEADEFAGSSNWADLAFAAPVNGPR